MMKTAILHNVPLLIAVLVGMVSCVYPFSIDSEGEGGSMVIEGDIFIGEYTNVHLSYSAPVSVLLPKSVDIPAEVCVMDDLGNVYPGEKGDEDGQYVVDTRTADPDRQYKLHVRNLETSRTYESTFQRVCAPAEIDSLSYILDEKRDRMNIAISMHSSSESYFKWSYVEDWEYHSYYQASLLYTPPTVRQEGWRTVVDGNGTMKNASVPEVPYYCWNHSVSKNIMVFSTEDQSDDRFVDLEFYKIDRTDRRISYIYHIAVQLEPLTKDAYAYWENVRQNSDYSGSLFAPNPSEVLGNITCLEDPSEFVYGYINAAQRSEKKMYVFNSEARFYKETDSFSGEMPQPAQNEWYEYYKQGFLPYYCEMYGNFSTAFWVYSRCVDCTRYGGNTKRPDFWAY